MSSARMSFTWATAFTNNKLICLDAGHFHPTEVISNKLSSLVAVRRRHPAACQPPDALGQRPRRHAGRRAAGDRHASSCAAICSSKTHIGLDFFDASINRVAAWVIGTRNTIKALLRAMLEPVEELQEAELDGDYTTRLALDGGVQVVSVRRGVGLLLRERACRCAKNGWPK